MTEEPTPVYYQGKRIGLIYESKKIYVTFRDDFTFFKKFNGFSLSSKLIRFLLEKDIKNICVYFKESYYFAPIERLLTNGTFYNNEGDEQYSLSIDKWDLLKEHEEIQIKI